MTIFIKPTYQAKRILRDMENLKAKHEAALTNALHEIGAEVVEETRRLILNPPKTGRIYVIKGRWHQASAPGEAPAWLTGRLARSGDYKVSGIEMIVGEDTLKAPYAAALEYGTRDGRIAPRPHIIKAIKANHQNMINAIKDNVKRAIEK